MEIPRNLGLFIKQTVIVTGDCINNKLGQQIFDRGKLNNIETKHDTY